MQFMPRKMREDVDRYWASLTPEERAIIEAESKKFWEECSVEVKPGLRKIDMKKLMKY